MEASIRPYEPVKGTTIELKVLEQVAAGQTDHQNAEVLDTENFGRVLMLDGIIQVGESDEFIYHESLVHPALLLHPAPASVAIIGGGDGGALEEVLKYERVERLSLVELDPGVVELSRRYMDCVHKGAFDDERYELVTQDGRTFLDERPGTFDALLLDLTDATGPSKRLYTKEFYRIAGESLKSGGVICVQCDSPVLAPEAFGTILRTAATVFPVVRPYTAYIPSFGALCAFAILSRDTDPKRISASLWGERLAQAKLGELSYLTAEMLPALWALPAVYQRVIDEGDQISTDADPFEIVIP